MRNTQHCSLVPIRFSLTVVCFALFCYSLICDRHQHHLLACFSVTLFTCLVLVVVFFLAFMVVFQYCSGELFSVYFVFYLLVCGPLSRNLFTVISKLFPSDHPNNFCIK